MEVRRSPELEALAAEARAAYESGRVLEYYAAHMADGEFVMTGSAADEIWLGKESVLDLIEGLPDPNATTDVRYELGEVEGYEAGGAGFHLWHHRYVLEDGSYIPLCGLTVYARDAGGWKMIGRFSAVLVPNELITPGSPIVVAEPPQSSS
jgi:hypothetical protein